MSEFAAVRGLDGGNAPLSAEVSPYQFTATPSTVEDHTGSLSNKIQELLNSLKISAAYNLEDNRLAGRLYHKLMRDNTTQTVEQYLSVFVDDLTACVRGFMYTYMAELNVICSNYQHSAAYHRILNNGILPATRLYDTYLLKSEDEDMYESIPHMFMRIAVFCACECEATLCFKKTIQHLTGVPDLSPLSIFSYFFDALSCQLVCCATPIMRCAGVNAGYLASCYILSPSLYSEEAAVTMLTTELMPLLLAKSGIGLSVTRFSQGSKGINNFLRVLNSCVEYVNDQNIRPVSVAVYMELWHYQICEFLSVKLPETPHRCGSIFQAVCIPQLFFDLYNENPLNEWYLFDPAIAFELPKLYGDKFVDCYYKLVQQKQYSGKVTCKALLFSLITTLVKTGTPYILKKESINKHHWFETQGCAINCANLCAEVIQAPNNVTSVCNLANVCLPHCLEVDESAGFENSVGQPRYQNKVWRFSFEKLQKAVEVATLVVNCAIMGGECATSGVMRGQKDKSMGLGVHGLADVFSILNLEYMQEAAEKLDIKIFENMYYHAVKTSSVIVMEGGGSPHHNWEKSKLAAGQFHWEGWENVTPTIALDVWNELRKRVKRHGTFNSQFLALMPTAGTSQLTGYSESFYPIFSNVSSHVSNKAEVLRANFVFLESVLPGDLEIVRACSAEVNNMPEELQHRYRVFRTAFDYNPKDQLLRVRKRAPFVDQSQSCSLFLKEEHVQKASFLKDLLLYGAALDLKTIIYYCRIQKTCSLSSLGCVLNGNQSSAVTQVNIGKNQVSGEASSASVGESTGTKGSSAQPTEQCAATCECLHCQ